jgi:hypothetical protein
MNDDYDDASAKYIFSTNNNQALAHKKILMEEFEILIGAIYKAGDWQKLEMVAKIRYHLEELFKVVNI